MAAVSDPYMVYNPLAMATELSNGKWIVARWEHLGPNEDLNSWRAKVEAACRDLDVDPIFMNTVRKSVTVVFNGALPVPEAEQIQESISAIELSRFMEREIGDELTVKTGRPLPDAAMNLARRLAR